MNGHNGRVEFAGPRGRLLTGRWEIPEGKPTASAVFAHCFPRGQGSGAAGQISRALVQENIAVLRFDFAGPGGFPDTESSADIEDIVAAGHWLAACGHPPTLLVGHSLGGAAVLAAAAELGSVRAVATIGAPAGSEHMMSSISPQQMEEIRSPGKVEVTLGSRTVSVDKNFLDSIAKQPQADRIRALDAALLVLHAPADQSVGVDNARCIFDAAVHPKSFVALDGADHLLTDDSDSAYAGSLIALWARRMIGIDLGDASTGPPPHQTRGVVVVTSDGTDFGQKVRAGRHELRADEPEPIGADSGPSPYDFLLAGLGACTAMTLTMYARRKHWDLQDVEVSLRHGRQHLTDTAESCKEAGIGQRIETIERTLRLTGDLDQDQRARLLEIADRCPVHRTLTSTVTVQTVLG